MTTTIVQISDTHLLAGDARAYGVVDTGDALDRIAAHLRALPETIGPIDAVIATGDIADLGEPAAYSRFRAAMEGVDAPVYALPGNHDDRDAFLAAFGADGYLPAEGPLDFAVTLGPVLVCCLDSIVPGQGGGRIGLDRLAALEDRLADHGGGPSALFLHHPPIDLGIGHMDRQRLANGDALAAVAARHPGLALVGCGHVHRMMTARFGHAALTVAPAPSHAVRLDLRADGPADFMLEPGAALIHRFDADGGCVSATSFIDASPGPFPFFPKD
jgi:3',5'-cyclic AMP phosphodiesterase CpdA